MDELLKKLNFKNHKKVVIINLPGELDFLRNFPVKAQILDFEVQMGKYYDFFLLFLKTKDEVDKAALLLEDNLAEDAVIWFVYPKKTSKKYKSEITRDSGWESLGKLGVEPVRMIAVNDDWSALRFRQVKNIKTMKRSGRAISEEGKRRLKIN